MCEDEMTFLSCREEMVVENKCSGDLVSVRDMLG
jgi:hypothetical protein